MKLSILQLDYESMWADQDALNFRINIQGERRVTGLDRNIAKTVGSCQTDNGLKREYRLHFCFYYEELWN